MQEKVVFDTGIYIGIFNRDRHDSRIVAATEGEERRRCYDLLVFLHDPWESIFGFGAVFSRPWELISIHFRSV